LALVFIYCRYKFIVAGINPLCQR